MQKRNNDKDGRKRKVIINFFFEIKIMLQYKQCLQIKLSSIYILLKQIKLSYTIKIKLNKTQIHPKHNLNKNKLYLPVINFFNLDIHRYFKT